MIDGIECMLLLTFITNSLLFKIFPLTNTMFLDLEGFTDICAQDKTIAAWFSRTRVCCRQGDIKQRLSMNGFTGVVMSGWEVEMAISADLTVLSDCNTMSLRGFSS